jgi:hypothetical protein
MRKSWFVLGAMAAATLLPAVLSAQRPSSSSAMPRVEITPYAGLMLPADLVSGPLGTRVGFSGGPVYGGQLGINLIDGITLFGNVGFATADVEAGVPILGGVSFGRAESLLYDGGLQVSLPGRNVIRPFLQVGAGGIRREITVAGVTVNSTAPAFQAGLGFDMSLGDNVGIRLLARDHVGKFDYSDVIFYEYDGGTMHNIALSGGLKLAF